ncbi:MAG: hypothetical protein LBM19_01340 [Holosporales bacterium]|jgi:hypothetical protein|nr:hypothetical protein [Holosporales bacterium]
MNKLSKNPNKKLVNLNSMNIIFESVVFVAKEVVELSGKHLWLLKSLCEQLLKRRAYAYYSRQNFRRLDLAYR